MQDRALYRAFFDRGKNNMIVRWCLAHITLFRRAVTLLIGERDIADNGRQFPLMGSVDQIVTSLPALRAARLVHIVSPRHG
jgi:hypothetical protein